MRLINAASMLYPTAAAAAAASLRLLLPPHRAMQVQWPQTTTAVAAHSPRWLTLHMPACHCLHCRWAWRRPVAPPSARGRKPAILTLWTVSLVEAVDGRCWFHLIHAIATQPSAHPDACEGSRAAGGYLLCASCMHCALQLTLVRQGCAAHVEAVQEEPEHCSSARTCTLMY